MAKQAWIQNEVIYTNSWAQHNDPNSDWQLGRSDCNIYHLGKLNIFSQEVLYSRSRVVPGPLQRLYSYVLGLEV